MSTVDDTDPPSSDRNARAWWFAALGVGVVALIVGLIFWLGGDDGDESSSTTETPTTQSTPTTAPTTGTTDSSVTSTTSVPPSSTSGTSTVVVTTTTVATSTTTEPATTVPTEPGGLVWAAASQYVPDGEVLMTRVDQIGGLSAYDGEFGDGESKLRCIAVVTDADGDWQEWCGGAGQATRFVAMHDDVPWLVEVGRLPGEVALLEQPADWTLPSNGCTAPIADLATTALTFESASSPAVVTSIICVPGEAFVGISTVWLQPGPVDGGGVLIVEDGDGWFSYGSGTSYGCDDLGDDVDRCDTYDVEYELFDALLPIPSPDTIGATDAVPGVTDRTAEVRGWVGDTTDPAVIDSLVVARLFDPTAEAPAIVRRADRLGYGGVNLLVVQIPQLDDSVATETWAVWIGALEETAGVTDAWSWVTCARGVTADGLCV